MLSFGPRPSLQLLVCRYDAGIEIRVTKSSEAYSVDVTADPVRPLVLHWGVNEWQAPPQDSWPKGTNQVASGHFPCRRTPHTAVLLGFAA